MPAPTSESELIIENANLKFKLKICHAAMKEALGGIDTHEGFDLMKEILNVLPESTSKSVAVHLAEAYESTGGLE